MTSVQDLRDARGSIIASGIAYVVTMKLEPGRGGHELAAALFAEEQLEKYERQVSAAFKELLGIQGGLGSTVTPERHIVFNLIMYRVSSVARKDVPVIRRIFGSGPSIGATTERLILRCLSDAVSGVEKIIGALVEVPIKVVATWQPGPHLTISDAIPADSSQSERRIVTLEQMRREAASRALAVGILAVVLALGAGIGVLVKIDLNTLIIAIFYAAIFGVIALIFRARAASATADIELARAQQDLSELVDEPRERRALKMFQVHNEQLKRYYDQALQQRAFIFGTGVLSILAGFGVIGTALWLLVNTNTSNTVKLFIGALGAIGGIMGNFIAVVYLRMFTETIKSVGSFHDRLVTTHHLHFANFLMAKISSGVSRDAIFGAVAKIAAAADRGRRIEASDKGTIKKKAKKKSVNSEDGAVTSDTSTTESDVNGVNA